LSFHGNQTDLRTKACSSTAPFKASGFLKGVKTDEVRSSLMRRIRARSPLCLCSLLAAHPLSGKTLPDYCTPFLSITIAPPTLPEMTQHSPPNLRLALAVVLLVARRHFPLGSFQYVAGLFNSRVMASITGGVCHNSRVQSQLVRNAYADINCGTMATVRPYLLCPHFRLLSTIATLLMLRT
jgi:hypothetical protein